METVKQGTDQKSLYMHMPIYTYAYILIPNFKAINLPRDTPVAGAREGCMVLGVRSAIPPAHSRTEGKQKATTPAPPQVASPQRFQRREALGSFLLLSTFQPFFETGGKV